VTPEVSQDFLASSFGTTRSRIDFFMNKFRELGFIEYDRNARVHSSLLGVADSIDERALLAAERKTELTS
jgi:CRP/FNR family cyclic AMP-dependent transcriptional regulator